MEILFENKEIFIINKPFNLATQGGQNIVNSVDSLMKMQAGEIHLVHRLDKETSGLLIVAKNPQSAAKWTSLISTRRIKKIYQALTFGTMSEKKGMITDSVQKKGTEKDAITRYSVLEEFNVQYEGENESQDFSLIELEIETGRMHQIRQHLAKKGCPIIQDDKYGDFKKNREAKKTLGLKKMLLMSKKIIFDEKLEKETGISQIEAEYPEHFRNSLDILVDNSYNLKKL